MYATQSIQLCDNILKEGVTDLSMGHSVDLAIVSHIVDHLYQIASRAICYQGFRSRGIVPARRYPLPRYIRKRNYHCPNPYRQRARAIAILYEVMDIEAFIGIPINKRGEILGNAEFHQSENRKRPF